MHASWTYRLRFIKKHLLMFLLAFGWLLIQTQVAVASHQCSMDLRGEVATIQHMEMMAQPGPHYAAGASPLCENIVCRIRYKKILPSRILVALPAAMTLTLTPPECSSASHSAWSVTPPAVGPPATIRYCRFRE